MGYEDVADRCRTCTSPARRPEAAAAIPLRMVEDVALVGPPDKIRAELDQWRETCLTTFLVSGPKQILQSYADLILG